MGCSMKILNIQVHNVLGVRDIEASLEGHHLWLVGGKNAQGKTSVLQSLVMALCGKRGCDWPGEPLRNGEDEGWVHIEMAGDGVDFNDKIRVERSWKRDGDKVREKMRVLSEEGFEAPTPQDLLSRLFIHRGFDPLEFMGRAPKEQADQLRALLGIDFSELDDHRKKFYEKRTEVNGAAKHIKAQIVSVEKPGELIDVREMEEEVSGAVKARGEVSRVIQKCEHDIESTKKDRDGLESTIEQFKSDLAELEKEYQLKKKQFQDRISSSEEKAAKCAESIDGLESYLKQKTSELDGFSGVDERVEELRRAVEKNEATRKQIEAFEQNEKRKQDVKKLEEKSVSLTESIEGVDREKARILSEAPWPVDGLSFGGDGLVYNGVPLEQCSTREKTDVSIALGMSANPKLRMMIIQHGESIDDDSMALIEQRAKEKDYQILVEFMTRGIDALEDRCQVVMEAGFDKKSKKKSKAQKDQEKKPTEKVDHENESGQLPGM